jgi:hypothetical protein
MAKTAGQTAAVVGTTDEQAAAQTATVQLAVPIPRSEGRWFRHFALDQGRSQVEAGGLYTRSPLIRMQRFRTQFGDSWPLLNAGGILTSDLCPRLGVPAGQLRRNRDADGVF